MAWSQTGTTTPTMGAVFGGSDAADDTYNITNSTVQVAVTSLTINNNGYAFWGPNAIYVGSSDTLSVAAGKTVTFNCNLAGSGTSPFWTLGAGATMNVTGNMTSGQQVRLAGASGSAYNLTGANAPAIAFILGQVNVSSGSLIPSSSFYIGYPNPGTINGVPYTSGTLNISGPSTVVTVNGAVFIIGRSGGSGTLNLSNGAVNVGISTTARILAINFDGAVGNVAVVNVSGGTLTVGSPTLTASTSAIDFFDTGESTGSTAMMNQSGGMVLAWGGLQFGAASGTPGTATLTNTGGSLFVGKDGIFTSTVVPTMNITLSGGTVGALANWSSSLPMTLATVNGNITFQCADNNNSPNNITLGGPLSGTGGLYVTGGGILTLSGTNTFSGGIAASNGTLAVVTGGTPSTNGTVTLDGSLGSPALTVQVSNPGQTWSITGLTFTNGLSTANIVFGSLPPSTSVAPVQVAGGVSFGTTPTVAISGSAIAVGTYPLIKYTGGVSGTMPTSATLPGYISAGYITNLTATKTIALVVTSSTYNPALYWAGGGGPWDINTTADWKQFSVSTKYQDGDAVVFDDSATGPSPISVALNTAVNPLSVTANNMSNQFIIGGTGSIAGGASVTLLNSGQVTLSGTNTYSGGTTVGGSSYLNINNGGSASGTAVGTGTLTLNAGATIDNTSGADVALQYPISQTWNGNFTYVGSSNNFNTGTGSVTITKNTTINVSSNNLTVGGSITDNGAGYLLAKSGTGTLTLPVANYFGGFTLLSGLVNISDPGALGSGSGTITFSGGSIDNISGSILTIAPPVSYVWGGSFTFVGSSDLELNLNGGAIVIPNGLGNITLNVVSNNLITQADIQNNNTEVIKTGNGTWKIAGASGGTQSLGLMVNAGQVLLDKSGGQAVTGGNNVGLTVQANAFVQDENNYQIHSDSAIAFPVNLFGGTWDLNGWNENVDKLSLTSGGTLQNSAAGTSTLNLISGYTASLSGTNCQFAVDQSGAILNFMGPIGGSGSLVKTGDGLLNLSSNSIYTGDTVIAGGIIALTGVGSISNTANIDLLTTNSTLDLSGETNSTTLALESGQTINGFGTLNGSLAALPGSGVNPGSATNVGTLTVTSNAILSGAATIPINATASASGQLAVAGSLAYGGTLSVINLSGTPTNGATFVLFSASNYSGSFSSITLPPAGPGLGWDRSQLQLATGGSISVVVATVPRIQSTRLSGGTLTIQGANGLPYEPYTVLESTNVAAALSTWTPVANSTFDGSGNFNISFSTSGPQEFYILQLQP